MANFEYVTRNRLTQESNKIRAKARKLVLIIGLPVVAAAFIWHYSLGYVALVVTALRFITRKGDDVIEAGAKGEDFALKLIKKLPEGFTVFNQVDLPSSKSRTGVVEADLIITGPESIFVVEVKHNNGEIDCSQTSPHWAVTKIGRGGTRYGKEMRNPVKQVKQQVWLLSAYLKSKSANAWIQPVVLFTNSNVSLVRSGELTVPVIESSEFKKYLQSYTHENNRNINPKAIQAIAELKA